ncbi:hypothetical protein Ahy_A06g027005 isoform B [Arachis hypogaea]|nr:hypothetical protein Ahy_A06g027005 isoform B [Arachis hypogaea]
MQASGAEANRAFTVISEATEWGSSSTARIGCSSHPLQATSFLLLRCLLRVLKKENSKLLTASAVFLPVHPMMVSVIQTRMMELTREPEASDRAVAQWHLWKSVVAEWCAALEEEKIGRSRCRQWWNDATKEGSTQTSFWWFEVTPSKHQNEFPSVPPVNSAYPMQLKINHIKAPQSTLADRVGPMEDSQEIEEQVQEEVISDNGTEKKQETRDEMLSRHR